MTIEDKRQKFLSTRHGRIAMERRTVLMGIVNVTPDSFYDGGRRFDPGKAVADGMEVADSGADIIDVGGESTRPGAEPVPLEEELNRVLPVIRGLRRSSTVPISIDTYKARVAAAALDEGADVINDISALRFDPEMVSVVAAERVPIVLMHMQGIPRSMQVEPRYNDVVREVSDFLAARLRYAVGAGVPREHIIIDPGVGFGKTLEHNLTLLRELPVLTSLGHPVLVGASRKAWIGQILKLSAQERMEGSLAAAAAAVLQGADIIRAHDVKETRRVLQIIDALRYGVRDQAGQGRHE